MQEVTASPSIVAEVSQTKFEASRERQLSVNMLRGKLLFFLFCALCSAVFATNDKMNLFMEEVRSLSELPLKRLIEIKSSLLGNDGEEDSRSIQVPDRSTALSLPTALPFKRLSSKKALRRHEDYWDEKGKDTKISKIFQLAVTALSFLAFGGYLLTLIITAIRRNANMAATNGNNVIVFSNLANLQKIKRPKRRAWIIDPMENDFDTDRMYRGMIMLSQGYTMYNNHR